MEIQFHCCFFFLINYFFEPFINLINFICISFKLKKIKTSLYFILSLKSKTFSIFFSFLFCSDLDWSMDHPKPSFSLSYPIITSPSGPNFNEKGMKEIPSPSAWLKNYWTFQAALIQGFPCTGRAHAADNCLWTFARLMLFMLLLEPHCRCRWTHEKRVKEPKRKKKIQEGKTRGFMYCVFSCDHWNLLKLNIVCHFLS